MGRRPTLRPIQTTSPSPSPSPPPLFSPLSRPSSISSPAIRTPSPAVSPFHQRRQPLILRDNGLVKVGRKRRCAEMAGGTAAGCAAVCCCFPCGLLDLLFLTIVRLPAGLCRKAIRRRKTKIAMKKQQQQQQQKSCSNTLLDVCGFFPEDHGSFLGSGGTTEVTIWAENSIKSDEIRDMDRDMWERFVGTGFWRSPSQRDPC